MRTVAVLGGGHGGHAAAADLTLRGHEVRWYSRSRDALAAVKQRGGIEIAGAAGEGFARVATVTDDLEEAVSGAEIVMTVVPTTALADYARGLAPLLDERQVVFLNPGHTGGGLHFVAELRRVGHHGRVRTCEVSTLTYGCRVDAAASVMVYRVMSQLPFAAFPGRFATEVCALVRELYPAIELHRHVLETAFLNLNAVEHPPQTLLNVGWLEHTRGDYYFYYEGTTPAVGRVIDGLDAERSTIAHALGVDTKSFVESFFRAGYTTKSAFDRGTAYEALHDSAPNRWVKGPQSLDHRYIHEDVGHALVAWAALGKLAGVRTPVMDALIQIASLVNERDYRSEGLTLHKLGLAEVARQDLESFLYEGASGREGSLR